MKNNGIYYNSHIIAAAIRIIEYRHSKPPGIPEICDLTGASAEHAGFVCSRMVETGILGAVESSDGPKYFIKNHLEIENLPKEETSGKMTEEIQKFKSRKDELAKKVEEFQEKQKQKQQQLFAKLSEELKQKN